LLSVDRVWFTEEYKRFYFRDIQAITVERTRSGLVSSSILGALALVSAFIFWLLSNNDPSSGPGFLIVGGITSGIFLILLAINFFRGPTCICRIRTAVQTESLPSLGRISSMRRALAIIKPLITEAQGALEHGEIPTNPEPAAPSTHLPIQPPAAPHTIRVSNGGFHVSLYSALMLDALAGFYKHAHMVWHLYTIVSVCLLLAILSFSITAVVRQRDTTIPAPLRILTVYTFVFVLATTLVVFIYGFSARMAYSMEHPGRLPPHTNFYSMPGFFTLSLVVDIIEIALGIAGLITTLLYIIRRGAQTVPPAISAPTPPAL
jgi:hypothetical protein